ncbi:MAG: YbgA family protein [Candidatus Goldiibacteriota bacterium]
MDKLKPKIYVSRCIEQCSCRYNAGIVRSEIVLKIMNRCSVITACPEVEIGLGIPRKPIHLEADNASLENIRLVRPSTGEDFTEKMKEFTENYLSGLNEIDGFIFKSKSPSSGFMNVKVYPKGGTGAYQLKTGGMFGGRAAELFPHTAMEDESRLNNAKFRDSFLKRIFISAKFRKIKEKQKASALMDFHAENKLLFMSYNQRRMRAMGKIAAASHKKNFASVLKDYENEMNALFSKIYRESNIINVFEHALGYFKDGLSAKEKKYFLGVVEKYRGGKTGIEVPVSLLKSYIIRFNERYLMRQSFFEPYPEELF